MNLHKSAHVQQVAQRSLGLYQKSAKSLAPEQRCSALVLAINQKLIKGEPLSPAEEEIVRQKIQKRSFTRVGEYFDSALLGGYAAREALAKSEQETAVANPTFRLCKMDEELGIIFGYAVVCSVNGEPFFDSQGDHFPENVMLKLSASFMEGDRLHKDSHQTLDAGGRVVFGFPLTKEIAEAFGITTTITGWMVGIKPSDPAILAKFKAGEYTGFSVGGFYIDREEVAA